MSRRLLKEFSAGSGGLAVFTAALCGALLLTGCTVGPKYTQPTITTPPAFKENAEWKIAQPSENTIRGKWWEIFGDIQLNSLEERIEVGNQNLKVFQARFEQARALVRFARAGKYPSVAVGTTLANLRQSETRALHSASSPNYYSDLLLSSDVSYEADVWGRVRQTIESSREVAQATAADLEAVRLSLHAELASDYFELRGLDAEKRLLDSTVDSYVKALELTSNRFRGGIATDADVAQAETQLATTRALSIDVGVQRAQREHAIAALVGTAPSDLQLALAPLDLPIPAVPVGVPSELLERRPDIAGAERRVAAANEQIGIAKTAFYPTVLLHATQGLEGRSFASWFLGPSIFWTVGPSAVLTVFDAGRRRSISAQAQAAYDQTAASYRQTVLVAFEEVEDNLSALRILQQEAQTQQEAIASAERSLTLSNNRYRGGVTSYLEVITAQNAALANELTAVGILRRRMSASVLLIKALGGGWNVSNLPAVP
jgi:NodT family efflux transporter outer membrane factor (OMF) lipoprotein